MGKIKQRLMLTMLNIVTVAFVTSVFGVCWLWFYAQAAQTGKATICFERYSADRYGVRLEEIAELPFTIAGEGAQG